MRLLNAFVVTILMSIGLNAFADSIDIFSQEILDKSCSPISDHYDDKSGANRHTIK